MAARSTFLPALVLVAAAIAGCGGGDAAPSEASQEEFCTAYTSATEDLSDLGPDPSDAEVGRVIAGWDDRLRAAGTPQDMPDDARKGFEVLLESMKDLDEDATFGDLSLVGDGLGPEQEAQAQALFGYVAEHCVDVPGESELQDLEDQLPSLSEDDLDQPLDDLESGLESGLGDVTESP